MSGLFNQVNLRLLEQGLTLLGRRQQLIANNLANVDTPGFKASDLDFRAAMNQVLAGGTAAPVVRTDPATTMRNDGNNVDVDEQMAKLAETGVLYSALSRQLSDELGIFRTAITGRG